MKITSGLVNLFETLTIWAWANPWTAGALSIGLLLSWWGAIRLIRWRISIGISTAIGRMEMIERNIRELKDQDDVLARRIAADQERIFTHVNNNVRNITTKIEDLTEQTDKNRRKCDRLSDRIRKVKRGEPIPEEKEKPSTNAFQRNNNIDLQI